MNRLLFLSLGLWLSANALSAQEKADKMDKLVVQRSIQQISKAIRENYVYPDKAISITDFLNSQYKSGTYSQLNTYPEFADKITEDIRSVQDDRHLRVEYNPKLEADIIRFNRSQEGKNAITKTDISAERSQNFFFRKLEILPANIGYIEFTNFALPSPEAQKTIQHALQFVANTDALIIDLRNNRGGSGRSNNILGYFFKERIKTGKSYRRITNSWTENFVEPAEFFLGQPVYVLTSKRTFSAAEGFAYILQNQRNATLIGEPTNGGAHLTRSFSLGDGFVGFIPYARSENEKTRTDWEGTGVIPTIKITADNALLAAQNQILNVKLTKADETEKRKIQWLINFNQSKTSEIIPDSTEFKNLTGRFAEFEITSKGGKLYFRDVNQASKTRFPMIPISSLLFQVGGDYQVEFVDKLDEKFQAINVSWSDGWTEKIKRSTED